MRSAYVTAFCVTALHKDFTVLLQEGNETIREIGRNLVLIAGLDEKGDESTELFSRDTEALLRVDHVVVHPRPSLVDQ